MLYARRPLRMLRACADTGQCGGTCLMVRLHRTMWQSALTCVRHGIAEGKRPGLYRPHAASLDDSIILQKARRGERKSLETQEAPCGSDPDGSGALAI